MYLQICLHTYVYADISADVSAGTSADISADTSAGMFADMSADMSSDVSANPRALQVVTLDSSVGQAQALQHPPSSLQTSRHCMQLMKPRIGFFVAGNAREQNISIPFVVFSVKTLWFDLGSKSKKEHLKQVATACGRTERFALLLLVKRTATTL